MHRQLLYLCEYFTSKDLLVVWYWVIIISVLKYIWLIIIYRPFYPHPKSVKCLELLGEGGRHTQDIYRPQGNIFTPVCHSIHREVCVVGGVHGGDMHGRGRAWQGARMAGGMHGRGDMHDRGCMCGRGCAWLGGHVCRWSWMVLACRAGGHVWQG